VEKRAVVSQRSSGLSKNGLDQDFLQQLEILLFGASLTIVNAKRATSSCSASLFGSGRYEMAHPERVELPTFWFVASSAKPPMPEPVSLTSQHATILVLDSTKTGRNPKVAHWEISVPLLQKCFLRLLAE